MSTPRPTRHGLFQQFFQSEISGSIVLLGATALALGWANSTWSHDYFALVDRHVGISWGDATFKLSLQHWVNDLLMGVFFFVVGLEIKREVVVGELSSWKRAVLPVLAAFGGMVVPATLYALLNPSNPEAAGFGIPMATDIAFALGILALFGKRVPLGLKVFLTALAIADDLGAVLVIALFYTERISWLALASGIGFLLLLAAANRRGIRRTELYLLLAFGAWVGVFASGVHATIAGVLVAMVIPVRAAIAPEQFRARMRRGLDRLERSELTHESMLFDDEQLHALDDMHEATIDMLPAGILLEHYLHPLQSFFVLPLFAFFNAGVAIDGARLSWPLHPVVIGIVIGLFVGKQIGVVGFSWLAIRFAGASLPDGVRWGHVWGAACLAGVGFTMSLFVSELAFADAGLVAAAKIGILMASAISGIIGYLLLTAVLRRGQ